MDEQDRRTTPEVPELTARAVLTGIVLGGVVASVNIYMGLRIGWTEGGSIFAAILGFVFLRYVCGGLTTLENNIVQTLASASGSLAGVMITVVAALALLGRPMSYSEISLYLLAVSLLGVLYAVPFRRQLVEVEELPFPTGTATASMIRALHARERMGVSQARVLGIAAALSAAVTWFRDGKPAWIPATLYLPSGRLFGEDARRLTLGVYLSPMLLAAGMIVGPRVGTSLLAGALVCWGVLAPWLAGSGIVRDASFREVTAWTLWPGMSLLVTYGLVASLLHWRGFARAFDLGGVAGGRSRGTGIPGRLWLAGFVGMSAAAVSVLRLSFGIPLWMGAAAILLSFVLALVSVRAAGETDINPTGTMGHATQLVFGGLAHGRPVVNLLAAGVTSAGASQAAELMQDLKAGYLLGSSPRRQVIAQAIGVLTGVAVIVPVFLLVSRTYGLGSESAPAPVAMVWSAFARVVAEGRKTLPAHAGTASVVGASVGLLLVLADRTRLGRFTPSGIGLGLAMVVPAMYCVPIFLGSLGKVLFRALSRERHDSYYVSVASGGIAGEGLAGILVAALRFAGVLSGS